MGENQQSDLGSERNELPEVTIETKTLFCLCKWMRVSLIYLSPFFLVIDFLLNYVFFRQLMHQDKGELAVTTSQIDTESEAWLAFNQPLE